MQIGIVAFEGFTDLDFFLPWDILNRVRLLKLSDDWTVDILGDEPFYKSASGLSIPTTKPYCFAEKCDAILITSGPKTRSLIYDRQFLSQLSFSENALIAGIDSGALIIAALGLLNQKEATTYPSAFETLKELGAIPKRASFVESGRVATATRCLEGEKLAFWIIENLAGKYTAEKVYETISPL